MKNIIQAQPVILCGGSGTRLWPLSRAGCDNYVQDVPLSDGIDFKDAVVYACGSAAMIASARSKLIAADLSPKNFHSDAFVSSKVIAH